MSIAWVFVVLAVASLGLIALVVLVIVLAVAASRTPQQTDGDPADRTEP